MARYPGGLITANSPVTASYPSGVWTNQEAAPYQSANVWGADPNFSNTVLLLHGDGSAGSNGQLGFADSSIYNFPFTVNGDAYVSTFSPYSVPDGYWSNYFDGTGDYLSFANSTVSNTVFGNTVPMTFEFWVYPISTSWVLGSSAVNSVGNYWWELYHNSTSGLIMNFGHWGYSSASASTGGDEQVPLNQWTHVVWQRRADNTVDVYYNGVAQTVSNGFSGGYIGMQLNGVGTVNLGGGGYYTPGPVYISNFRFTKSQVYSGNFTPPTAPLSTIANTSLLTCQSNRFVDNSSTNAALTRNGDTSVQVSNPFTTSLNSNTGSGYFDGTGDKINTPSNVAFGFGTGDFTVELWIYPISVASKSIYHGTTTNSFIINVNGSNQVVVRQYGVADLFTTTGALTLTAWNHVAVSRSSTTLSVWINGSRQATGSNSTNFATTAVYIGAADTTSDSAAYISDVRTVKGTAVYSPSSSTIEIPTQPLTAIAGTSLLACQYPGTVNNGGFIDSSPYNFRIIRNGNTTQGSFTPFSKPDGRWGNFFDGDDNLNFTNSSNFAFGTGAFTIEFWINGPANNDRFILGGRSAIGTMHITTGGIGSTGGTLRYVGSSTISSGSTLIVDNQWHHCAIVRDGSSNITLYVDGVSRGTGTDTTNYTSTSGTWYVGQNDVANSNYLIGYLSNLRIVKGTAVYTTAFTPPTAPLTAISNTSLLTCQSDRFRDNSGNSVGLGIGGNTKVTPFSPFPSTTAYDSAVNSGSGYFDGSGDYLTAPANPAFSMGSGDLTIEAFVYTNNTGGNDYIYDFRVSGSESTSRLYLYQNGANLYMGFGSTDDILVSSSFQLNSWNHFAVVRSGSATNNVSVFLNGSRVHQRTDTTNFSTNSAPYIASRYNATETLLGYASNFRVLKGVAQYSGSTYTVPTAPLTAVSGTSLLLNFTNAGIFDNTGFNTFETFENSATTTALTKYGHGSMYFDGTNDYLIAQTGTIPAIRTGDFTVECWTYLPYVTPTACWRALISIGNGHQTAGAFTLYAPRADAVIGSAVVIINQVNPTLGGTTSINDRQWHHVAVTRSGTTLRLFVDGVLQASTSNSADITQTQVVIGRDINCSTTYFQGYIDDARITVGVARYTANFTPPPARFPNQ